MRHAVLGTVLGTVPGVALDTGHGAGSSVVGCGGWYGAGVTVLGTMWRTVTGCAGCSAQCSRGVLGQGRHCVRQEDGGALIQGGTVGRPTGDDDVTVWWRLHQRQGIFF